MSAVIEFSPTTLNVYNPLDSVEDLLIANDWSYERLTNEELFIKMAGEYAEYDIVLQWLEPYGALKVCCRMKQQLPDNKVGEAILVSNEINHDLWTGHFSLDRNDPYPTFYNTILLKDDSEECEREALSHFVETTLEQCERYAPVYSWLIKGGDFDRTVISLLVMDNAGHA